MATSTKKTAQATLAQKATDCEKLKVENDCDEYSTIDIQTGKEIVFQNQEHLNSYLVEQKESLSFIVKLHLYRYRKRKDDESGWTLQGSFKKLMENNNRSNEYRDIMKYWNDVASVNRIESVIEEIESGAPENKTFLEEVKRHTVLDNQNEKKKNSKKMALPAFLWIEA